MSSDKLSPGDLAIIIRSADGLSVGKIVECVQVDFLNHSQYGVVWLVKSTRNDLVTEYGGVGDNVHVPQDWLRKTPNDPLNEEDLYKIDTLETVYVL